MNTVFIGGSRHVSRLSPEVKKRLDNVIASGHKVVVGDANGADKAVQKHFFEACYDKVTVFCSGEPRNNIGRWEVEKITPPKSVKGFQFYAAKDREMARAADFGLMIWDGKSPGTVLNVLRLVRAGKISVLFHSAEKRAINIKGPVDWNDFLQHCTRELIHDLQERATSDEWSPGEQGGLLKPAIEPPAAGDVSSEKEPPKIPREKVRELLNSALSASDPAAFMDTLGSLAKFHGMSRVAKDTGLARESLYRALGGGGNPEFATVLKVVSCLGMRLTAEDGPAIAYPSDIVHGCALTSRQNRAAEMRTMAVMVEHVAPDLRPLLESIWCDSKAGACYSVTLHPYSREAAEAIARQLEVGTEAPGGGGGHNGIDVSGNDGGSVDRDPYWPADQAADQAAEMP